MSLGQAVPQRSSRFAVQLPDTTIHASIQFFDKVKGEPCAGEKDFIGAYAIVRYEINSPKCQSLRERVMLIDQEQDLPNQPISEKTVPLVDGVASDIQLFGYKATAREAGYLWRFIRQELYFGNDRTPFLILHWKHTTEQIILIDVIQVK